METESSSDGLSADAIAPGTAPRFESIDIADLDYRQRYKLLTGSIIPRPIAFVSTLNASGSVNLAPFSNFVILSSVDGILGFSVGRGTEAEPREKDTLRNILANREFVIQTVPVALAQTVQACAAPLPPEVSEAELNGLTLLGSTVVSTPRIAETPIQFECRLHSVTAFGESHLVAGRVVMIHAREFLVDDHKIDPRAYGPLARLGGRVYCELGAFIAA